jgi:hypothetical protein
MPTKPLPVLDRRQSNPDLLSVESQELVAEVHAAPILSKIEEIIGPESRYYNNEPRPAAPRPTAQVRSKSFQDAKPRKSAAVSTPTRTVDVAAPPVQPLHPEVQVQTSHTNATTKYSKPKSNRSLMLRVAHAVSKKSWKLVRYIGGKGKRFMSMMLKAVDPTGGACEA